MLFGFVVSFVLCDTPMCTGAKKAPHGAKHGSGMSVSEIVRKLDKGPSPDLLNLVQYRGRPSAFPDQNLRPLDPHLRTDQQACIVLNSLRGLSDKAVAEVARFAQEVYLRGGWRAYSAPRPDGTYPAPRVKWAKMLSCPPGALRWEDAGDLCVKVGVLTRLLYQAPPDEFSSWKEEEGRMIWDPTVRRQNISVSGRCPLPSAELPSISKWGRRPPDCQAEVGSVRYWAQHTVVARGMG